MNRKSILVMLAVLVVLSLVLGGCKKSATPPLADIQSEDESAKMVEEAGSNPTPVVIEPVTEEATTAEPVEETTEVTTPEATEVAEATEETTETVLPVVTSGDETAATPEAAATPETTSTPGKHVVQAGENLFRIALRYGTTVEAISNANGITNAALIYVGQVLTIPGGTDGGSPAPAPAPSDGEKVHIVQPGENLFRIALKYNYSQYYLAEYNGISNPALIYVGQVIRIP
jgi:LysM repeat protein